MDTQPLDLTAIRASTSAPASRRSGSVISTIDYHAATQEP